MKRILFLISLAIGALSLNSCEKKMDEVDVTKNAYLLDRAFQIKSIMFTGDFYAEFPVYEDILIPKEPCEKDDFYFFNNAGMGSYHDNFLKCSASAPDNYPIFFNISNEDTYITIYTNPDDPGASIKLQGKMETETIDKFIVTHNYYNEHTEKTEELIYTFEKIEPTDI